MDFKEYLKAQNQFLLSDLAFRMWPGNTHADTYLSAKLNGNNKKVKWLAKDEKLARKALKQLGITLVDNSKVKNGGEFDLGKKEENKITK